MIEVLSQLPPGVTPSKEVVVQHLGKLAALATKEGMTPDELLGRLISAWRRAKR